MASAIKKLAGQTVIYGLGTIVPRFLNYFLTYFLTREYLPAQYGINSELYAYISFLNVIFTYGMETTFFNYNSKNGNKASVYSAAMVSIFSSTLFLSLLLIIATPWISASLSTPNAAYPSVFITWSILIVASDALMAIPFAQLRADNKAFQFSMLKLGNVLINFSLVIFFTRICKNAYESNAQNFFSTIYDPAIGIGYVFLSNLIANALTLLLLSKRLFSFSFKLDIALLKEMLNYTWPLLILGLAGMVNETLDRIILKKLMVDKAEAQVAQGIYGACYKIAILMTIFIQAFRFAAEPFFFNKSKDQDSKKTYALVMKYFIIFCLFIFLVTLMNLDWIRYFIDKPYWSGLKVVPVLLLANLCLGVVYNLSIWYKLSGRTRFGALISVSGAVITVLVNVIFVPSFSYVACAWATLAAYGFMMVLSWYLGQKYYPVNYNLRAITVYSIAALGLYLVSLLYSSLENAALKITLNNMLVIIFAGLVYMLEIPNIKKLSAHANSSGKGHQ